MPSQESPHRKTFKAKRRFIFRSLCAVSAETGFNLWGLRLLRPPRRTGAIRLRRLPAQAGRRVALLPARRQYAQLARLSAKPIRRAFNADCRADSSRRPARRRHEIEKNSPAKSTVCKKDRKKTVTFFFLTPSLAMKGIGGASDFIPGHRFVFGLGVFDNSRSETRQRKRPLQKSHRLT